MKVPEAFQRLPSTIAKLQGHERISDFTAQNILKAHEDLSYDFRERELDPNSLEFNSRKQSAIALIAAVGLLDSGEEVASDKIADLALEGAQVLSQHSTEVFVFPPLDADHPRVFPIRGDEGDTVLIFDGDSYSIVEDGLRGNVLHEVAHIHEQVHRLTYRKPANRRKGKVGEALADIFALAAGGPTYPPALVRYLRQANLRLEAFLPLHPSGAARVKNIREETQHLWKHDLCGELLDLLPEPENIPETEAFMGRLRQEMADRRTLSQSYKLDGDLVYQVWKGSESPGSLLVEFAVKELERDGD